MLYVIKLYPYTAQMDLLIPPDEDDTEKRVSVLESFAFNEKSRGLGIRVKHFYLDEDEARAACTFLNMQAARLGIFKIHPLIKYHRLKEARHNGRTRLFSHHGSDGYRNHKSH